MCLLWGHNHAYLQCTKAPLIDCHSLHIVWGTCTQKPCTPMILSFEISRIWLMMASLFYVRLIGLSNHLKAVLSRMACGCSLYRNNYITHCPIAIYQHDGTIMAVGSSFASWTSPPLLLNGNSKVVWHFSMHINLWHSHYCSYICCGCLW